IHPETNMKAAILLAALSLVAALPRVRREAYELPNGVELVLGRQVQTSFQCERDGYFADVDNDCKVFHVCRGVQDKDGQTKYSQYTFACGNQTMFNQASFTCAFTDEAVPCSSARDFFYLNDHLFQSKDIPILDDQDTGRASSLYTASRAA
ncbi:hypothetical protein HPB47_020179, partial [Ixodes persulcatus]